MDYIVISDSADDYDVVQYTGDGSGGSASGGGRGPAVVAAAPSPAPSAAPDQAAAATARRYKIELAATENELIDLEAQLEELQGLVSSVRDRRDHLRTKLQKHEAEDEARRNRKDWSKVRC